MVLLDTLLVNSNKRCPANIALQYNDEQVSYEQLLDLSEKLSACLTKKGVTVGDCVGIYLNKSIEVVVSIFGILRTGAAYVPLDPSAPPQRQAYIIRDCNMHFLITSTDKLHLLEQLSLNSTSLKCIFNLSKNKFLNKTLGTIEIISRNEIFNSSYHFRPSFGRKNTDLAYILYTSGSTGQPKGVMFSHKSSINFIIWAYRYFKVSEKDKIISQSPFHFDLSIFDIFVTIMAGATICLVPQGVLSFPRSLSEFIEQKKITIYYSVPYFFIQLLLYGKLKNKDFSPLRLILFAGDRFPTKYLCRLMRILNHVKFYNLYGPTETNVCTCYHVKSEPVNYDFMPIGKPCANAKMFAFDEQGRLLKPGLTGELYVSTPSLMKGYLGDLFKTRNVLVKYKICRELKGIFYRTGDLVTLDKAGNYIFIGRVDGMIKTRGCRVELSEIETVLYKHPQIKEVLAIGIPYMRTGYRIKVIVVPERRSVLCQEDVKKFCAKYLSSYMIPEIVEFRESLPKTSSGKTDKQAIIGTKNSIERDKERDWKTLLYGRGCC